MRLTAPVSSGLCADPTVIPAPRYGATGIQAGDACYHTSRAIYRVRLGDAQGQGPPRRAPVGCAGALQRGCACGSGRIAGHGTLRGNSARGCQCGTKPPQALKLQRQRKAQALVLWVLEHCWLLPAHCERMPKYPPWPLLALELQYVIASGNNSRTRQSTPSSVLTCCGVCLMACSTSCSG
jgi:hypothetical protein